MEYQVTVDRSACIACGIAPNICPQVFVLGGDNGKNRIIEEYTQEISEETSIGRISNTLHNCVQQAVESCPVQAISIEEIT